MRGWGLSVAVAALLLSAPSTAQAPGPSGQADAPDGGLIIFGSTSVNGNVNEVGDLGSSRGFEGRNNTVQLAPPATTANQTDNPSLPPDGNPSLSDRPANVTLPVGPWTDYRGEGAVRLVSRVDVNGYATGALQVFYDGAWGAVCNAGFDNRDALVACRQLGFTTGMRRASDRSARFRSFPDEVVAPFALENLRCTGTETRLLDCPAADGPAQNRRDYNFDDFSDKGRCDPASASYTYVACGGSSDAAEGDLRLTGGNASADGSAEYGRLEVFHSGGWGTVCDLNGVNRGPRFNNGSARVACNELGYGQGFQIQGLEDTDEALTQRIPIVLPGVLCEGTEDTLRSCPGFEMSVGDGRCRHNVDVHLVCSSGPNAALDGELRLMDGTAGDGYEYGRVEVFLRGFWSNVCSNDRFTPDSAQVACKALGYGGGAALRFTQSYANSLVEMPLSQILFSDLPVALAGVACDGTEASLLECPSNDRAIEECTNRTSSTILACANSAPGCQRRPGVGEGAVRLRGGFGTLCDPVHTGFVEIFHLDEWGSICKDRFSENRAEDNLVADVVCRQLGFPHGTRVNPLTRRPLPPPPPPTEGVRFISSFDGVVEEAEEPVERFWLNDVQCNGPEGRLIDCNLEPGFLTDGSGCSRRSHRLTVACRQFPVVEALEAVATPGAEEGDVRLLNETTVANWVTGQLQVFFEGSWSQVCAGLFDSADANVACRQLGYGAGTVVPQVLVNADRRVPALRRIELRTTPVFPEVAISASGCQGNETRLLDCTAEPDPPRRFSRACRNSNSAGLFIACIGSRVAGAEGALRLTGRSEGATPGAVSGVPEIFHAGAWGSLCSGPTPGAFPSNRFQFTEGTAAVACRQMGFTNGSFRTMDGLSPKVPPPWLSSVRCVGSEPRLSQCERSAFGDTSTCGASLRLFCSLGGDDTGEVRLVGGSAAPGGAWEYGRLEILADGFWSMIDEGVSREDFGRRGTLVACRQLGYANGAQLLAGRMSALPTEDMRPTAIRRVSCDGSEDVLTDCDIEFKMDGFGYDYFDGIGAIAVVCTNPSGCESPANTSPTEGDLRLVSLNGTTSPTAACDDVHFGGVELFHDGRWGRICSERTSSSPEEFTLDAQVVCRQLGFPFGGVMDADELRGAYDGQDDDDAEPGLVWATTVACTGKEDRLLDCGFPEGFDNYSGDDDGPDEGVIFARCSRTDNGRLAVVCRQFEITESDVIRR